MCARSERKGEGASMCDFYLIMGCARVMVV